MFDPFVGRHSVPLAKEKNPVIYNQLVVHGHAGAKHVNEHCYTLHDISHESNTHSSWKFHHDEAEELCSWQAILAIVCTLYNTNVYARQLEDAQPHSQ